MKDEDDIIYKAWREAEAYAVPMTEKGEELARERYEGFKMGWQARNSERVLSIKPLYRENY